MSNILYANPRMFKIHTEVEKTHSDKDYNLLKYSIKRLGQETPVKVVKEGNQLYIIDGIGVQRSLIELNIDFIKYEIVDVKPEDILQYRMICNMKTKNSFIEIGLQVEYYLDLYGSSQGKKRDILGFHDFKNDSNFGRVAKDRYNLVCALMGLDMKGSTLRKLMEVFWSEYNPNGPKSKIIELLDKGEISINKAHKLIKAKEKKIKNQEDSERARMYIAHSNLTDNEKPYKLFCKSGLNMSEVADESVNMIIDSHPYVDLREYRNQDDLCHGKESSIKEYLKNFRAFNEEKFRVLKKGGVLATIIGETYREGSQGICSRVEMVLLEIGFKLIDINIWIKTNQRYTPHPFRFRNSYERIIVVYKPGAEPTFNEVLQEGSVDDFDVKETSTGGHYMARPNTCIPNVIITPVFNNSVLREIDPNFTHDAPCPPEIYEIFIAAYSNPGEVILDGFVGSGTIGIGLKMGRRVIGYDVDPVSIEFCHKRFEKFLSEVPENNLALAA